MLNEDMIIYKHGSSKFLFLVTDVTNYNELKIEICNYHGRGILLLDDPFYESKDTKPVPWKSVFKNVSIPKDYNITPNNCLKNETGGMIREYISPKEKEKFNLSESLTDFYVSGYNCYPQLYFLSDGRKFIIYKKFNYLFIRELNSDYRYSNK